MLGKTRSIYGPHSDNTTLFPEATGNQHFGFTLKAIKEG